MPRIGPSSQGLALVERRRDEWLRAAQETPPAMLPARIAKLERELIELFAGFRARDLLANLYFANIPHNAEAYVESEHEGLAAAVELAAALLVARPADADAENAPPRMIGSEVLGPAQPLLRELLFLESLRMRHKVSLIAVGVEAHIRSLAFSRYLVTRGESFDWQEADLLRLLFDDERSRELLLSTVGFTVEDALAVVAAVEWLTETRFNAKRQAAATLYDAIQAGNGAEGMDDFLAGVLPHDAKQRRRMARSLVVGWTFHDLGDTLAFSVADASEDSGIDLQRVTAVIDALALSFGVSAPLFQRFGAVRRRPYVRVGDNRYLCTYPGSDLWALRHVFEHAIKGAPERSTSSDGSAAGPPRSSDGLKSCSQEHCSPTRHTATSAIPAMGHQERSTYWCAEMMSS
jgi:hypothetical protein